MSWTKVLGDAVTHEVWSAIIGEKGDMEGGSFTIVKTHCCVQDDYKVNQLSTSISSQQNNNIELAILATKAFFHDVTAVKN